MLMVEWGSGFTPSFCHILIQKWANEGIFCSKNKENSCFIKNNLVFVWWFQIKAVPLHRQLEVEPSDNGHKTKAKMSKQNSPSQITDMILVHYYMTYKGSNSATLDCTRFYKNKQAAYSDIKGAFHNWMGKMNRLTVEVGIPYFTDGGFLVLDYEKSLAFGLNTVRPWNDRTGRKLIFALVA